jgi:hypothetical protein
MHDLKEDREMLFGSQVVSLLSSVRKKVKN